MIESMETSSPSVEGKVDKVKEDLYPDLKLAPYDEILDLADSSLRQEIEAVKSGLDELADIVANIPFDHPSQRYILTAQIDQLLTKLIGDAEAKVDEEIDETERELLKSLIDEINGVIEIGMTLAEASDAMAAGIEREEKEFKLTRADETRNLGDILRGASSAVVSFDLLFISTMERESGIIDKLYGEGMSDTLFKDEVFLTKGLDGNMYITDPATMTVFNNLPPFPALCGLKVRVETYDLPTKQNEVVFGCEPGSREEKSESIDMIINDPFVKTAEITYTERSIAIYKKKYPDFPYKAGEKIKLVPDTDRKFYFDNGSGRPNKSLPRAFVFSGDTLNYESEIDTIDVGEGDLMFTHMDEYLNRAFDITEKAEAFYDKYGIRLVYKKSDLDEFSRDYASRKKGVGHLGMKPKSKKEIVAAIDYFDKILDDYGSDFVKGDVETIYIAGSFDKHVAELEGVCLGEGTLVINTLGSAEHEFFHAADKVTTKGSRLDGGDWFDETYAAVEGGQVQEGADPESGSSSNPESATLYDYTEKPTADELEMFYKTGVTSRYAFDEGRRGNTDEIQAEIWKFLRINPDASNIVGKKEGEAYAYPKLRENVAKVLDFSYGKSKDHMDRQYWVGRNQIFDDDLWAEVEKKTA